MTQRYREVSVLQGETKVKWIEHAITDAGVCTALSSNLAFVEKAGGQSFHCANSFTVSWRVHDNIAEIILDGINRAISTHRVRITCNRLIVGHPTFSLVGNELTLMMASLSSVHFITFDTSKLKKKMAICFTESHTVNTDSVLVQCSAKATEDFGILFSLTTESGKLLMVNAVDGKYEEIILQQTSLLGTIWNKVRRSVVSGPTNHHDVVFSAISDEHPSIYCLTRNLQVQQWAMGTWECLATHNLLNTITTNQQVEGVAVKYFPSQSQSFLGIALADGEQSKIMLVCLSDETGSLGRCVLTADCGANKLIAYELVEELLFILWENSDGVAELVHLAFDVREPKFLKCCLDAQILPPVELESWDEPREKFCEILFGSNKVSRSAIVEALHKLDPASVTVDTEDLKAVICDAVMNKIRSKVETSTVTNAEYREVQIDIWQSFYTNVAQYHQVFQEPIGLVAGCPGLPIALITKGSVSYLRPCEALEQQILFPSDPLDSSSAVNQDVVSIMQAAFQLQNTVQGFEDHVYLAVLNSENVFDTFEQVLNTITRRADHAAIKARFCTHIQGIHLLHEGFTVFLHLLNIANNLPADAPPSVTDENPFSSISETGQLIVCSSVHDIAEARYRLCCRLILFLQYLTRLGEEVNRCEELKGNMDELFATLHALLRNYVAVLWICRLNTHAKSLLDLNTEMLDALRISNSETIDLVLSSASTSHQHTISALYKFLAEVGGAKAFALIQPSVNKHDYYEHLDALTMATCQTLWPETPDLQLPEFLLASNELTALQDYCMLLEGHCKTSYCSRMFLLGQTYLLEREPEKAYACFMETLYGLFEEGADTEQADMQEEAASTRQLQFCSKVIEVFEKFSYSEQVVLMSQQTLKLTNVQQSSLSAKIFRHNLKLRHYDEAFKAILAITDHELKMNCLYQFVSTLCDTGELKTLASYPYKEMDSQEDLKPAIVSLLLKKARTVDLTVKNYYDLLYAFLVINNDMLSAANVMYECCGRLSCELSGIAALQKKAKCLLACIHALQCVPTSSAWIAPDSFTQSKYMPGREALVKRTSQGKQKPKSMSQVKILTLQDIEKEYMLVNMALRLSSNSSKQISSAYQDPNEIITLLCSIGMYDEAIEVCTTYNFEMSHIFESLAFRCIRMMKEAENSNLSEVAEESKVWLTYNRLPTETSYSSCCDQAWKILRHYLQLYDIVSTKYHKIVVNKLLANNSSLPEWLISSYKFKNVAELLKIYLQYDLIEEAVDLSTEFLTAVTGSTFEKFGLESSLSATMGSSSVWVPYTSLDVLLNLLEEYQSDPYYLQLFNKLKSAIEHYTSDLEDKSHGALKLAQAARYSTPVV